MAAGTKNLGGWVMQNKLEILPIPMSSITPAASPALAIGSYGARKKKVASVLSCTVPSTLLGLLFLGVWDGNYGCAGIHPRKVAIFFSRYPSPSLSSPKPQPGCLTPRRLGLGSLCCLVGTLKSVVYRYRATVKAAAIKTILALARCTLAHPIPSHPIHPLT